MGLCYKNVMLISAYLNFRWGGITTQSLMGLVPQPGVNYIPCTGGQVLTPWANREVPENLYNDLSGAFGWLPKSTSVVKA